MDYLKRSNELYEETVANRRYLHQNPEIGMDLPKTSAYIMDKLKEMGYEPVNCGGDGIVATVGKDGGKTVLLRISGGKNKKATPVAWFLPWPSALADGLLSAAEDHVIDILTDELFEHSGSHAPFLCGARSCAGNRLSPL